MKVFSVGSRAGIRIICNPSLDPYHADDESRARSARIFVLPAVTPHTENREAMGGQR
jgi:hypothetical protein